MFTNIALLYQKSARHAVKFLINSVPIPYLILLPETKCSISRFYHGGASRCGFNQFAHDIQWLLHHVIDLFQGN